MKTKVRILTSFLKGLRIMERMASGDDGLSLAEAARMTNLPASNTVLYMNTLVESGAALRDPISKRYFVSPAFIERSRHADRGTIHRMLLAADEPMRKLHEKYNENVLLGFPRNVHIVFLKHIASNHIMRINIEPEPDYPMHVTAAGRSILAFYHAKEIKAYLKTANLEKLTSKTVTSKTEIVNILARIRENGYAFNPGEFQEDVMALAAPIMLEGRPVGCIDIQFPTLRHSAREAKAAAKDVINAVHEVESHMK
ncbi:MAG: hypothetical protein A2283_12140 [Lentisphaerae bacterium RIFOXYA12_FULL_48_11]|nr:MAG: hypothetical protein A2283_12140 [Lentisphaerae bacterium RIFOXYA12_FULL_48_11]